ncbi:FG-GAP repeat protein [Wenzhouxiangella marina]|uniref:Integrin alpha beta-propellor repeat protein n=1 Tax=Wenzhouxiangella marina TaxID=1579979 RepID=A0A0K0XU54_9GAMM|nr:FG-GAP repeat protein [Wenzhouxiangella marina]AKS41167.1 Integrin alpha beta-propellor repeat protein [Wenzhouxiangella marina]MBB6088046.1 hypothetical protein [Wenzhouxiangella marina]
MRLHRPRPACRPTFADTAFAAQHTLRHVLASLILPLVLLSLPVLVAWAETAPSDPSPSAAPVRLPSGLDVNDWQAIRAGIEAHRQSEAIRAVSGSAAGAHTATHPRTVNLTFAQQAYLKASNTGQNDALGYSVAISGDTVVVGAFLERSGATGVGGDQDDDSATAAGAAYVFVRDEDQTWTQQAYLKASNAELGDQFGWSVAISGDTIAVGANAESSSARGVNGDQDDNAAPASGAVYVFVRDGTSWSQQAYLKASNTDPLDRFGHSVAISGDRLVVGAPFEDSPFTRPDITNDLINKQWNRAPDHDAGAVYVFVRNEGSWTQQVYLKPSWNSSDDRFGHSVAISGDTVVVGSPNEDSSGTGVEPGNGDSFAPVDSPQRDDSAPQAGAVWVFLHDPDFFRWNGWKPQAYVKASNTDAGDAFGSAIAISGDTLVIGAPGEDSEATGLDGEQGNNSANGAGATYVFQRSEIDNETVWQQQAYLKASNTGQGDQFGWSVAISGDMLVVAAEREDSGATGVDGAQDDDSAVDSGAAYLFRRSGAGWQQQAYLKASNTGPFDAFGLSAAVSGTTAVVGAPAEGSAATGVNGDGSDDSAPYSGAAYVFDLARYLIGGTVSGLGGTGLVLQNNGGDDLEISANGAFAFPTTVLDGNSYSVTVASQPTDPDRACTVTNGQGVLNGADITDVQVTCRPDAVFADRFASPAPDDP